MPHSLAAWLQDRNRGYVLLIVGAVFALYLPFLGNPFFFDDLSFFSAASAPASWLDALGQPRGLSYNTLLWTKQWFGDTLPHAYRLVDAVLHAATACTLFAVIRNLLRSGGLQDDTSVIDCAAAVAALVFALHPVASYAAGYVIQRSIVMATLFSLLAVLAWREALLYGRRVWLSGAVVAYLLACLSKEHAVALPLVLAAMLVLLRRQSRASLAALGVAALAMAAIGWMTVARVQGVVGMAYEPMSAHLFAQSSLPVSPGLSHALSIATQAGLYFRYLLLWLLPAPAWMAIDMRAEFLPGFGRWEAWAGPIAFAAYGVLATRLLFARGLAALAGFGLLYPWLLYPLEFSSIRVQETFVLYRSYLWMPGLMLVLATLVVALQRFSLRRSLSMPGLRAALLVSCVLLLAPATVDRLQVASDGWRLWDDAARLLANDSVPGADRILYNRANAALAAGRYREAVSDLQRVVAISPQLMPVHHALGNAYLANGQPGPAEQEFRLALSHPPANPALRYAWAISLKRTGREAEAREQMRVSCAGNYMPACMVTARLGKDAAPR